METSWNESETPYQFLSNSPNMCIVCNNKLAKANSAVSVQEILPQYKPPISLLQGLKLLSNVGDVNIDNVSFPLQACKTCFLKTDDLLHFQKVCHKAVCNIKGYILTQERIQNHIPKTECDSSASSSDEHCMVEYPEEILDVRILNEEEVKQKHESKKLVKLKKKVVPKVECTVCHKLICKHYFNDHMNTHTGKTPHQCKFCDKKFAVDGALRSHMRIHHGTGASYLCPICGITVKDGTRHKKIMHSDLRPYPCDMCDKAYKTRGQLNDHYVMHTGEKNFQCEKCPKKFANPRLLRQHSVTHAEVRPIECTYCGKRFTQQHSLKSHQAKACEAIKAIHSEANEFNPI